MSEEAKPGETEKKHVGADLLIPAIALVFTLYYFSTIINSPWTAQVSAFMIGAILIALITAFVAYTVITIRRGEADLGMHRMTAPRSFLPKRIVLFALTLGFVILVQWGGFTLTTFAFLSLAMLLLSDGRNWKFILGLSAVLAIGGYFLFVYAFEVRFPKGPVELLMSQVL